MRYLRKDKTLSKVEKIKQERHPLEVYGAIIETYSKDLSAMDAVPGEVERLKWVGIYPQKQGGDAFMMRIKIPGGVLTPEQTRVVGKIAADFARGPIPNPHFGNNFLDLTTRQDVQMHWIKMENVPEIWRRLEEAGITTVQACGDSARNVLCCPVSGLGQEEAIDAYPVAQAISAYFTGNREYANLPRKFKMSVTGCLEDCAQAEINDVGMLPARLEDGTLGFNLRVGGGLSDGPRMASDIDVFVRPEEAVEIGEGARLATDQNLIITGVPEERLDELLAEPLLARYSPKPGAFERGVVACTGSEFCRFGIVETKVRAVEWARAM